MAIDYLIGTLIAASSLVNALALGAFWVTPGLRTTANRFVINLLIVNLIGCVALMPSLFGSWSSPTAPLTPLQSAGASSTAASWTTEEAGLFSQHRRHHALHRYRPHLADTAAATVDSLAVVLAAAVADPAIEVAASTAVLLDRLAPLADERQMTAPATTPSTISVQRRNAGAPTDEVRWESVSVFWGNTRHWGFDLTAALGALSVLLIVGDTWFAVTDPLRYHARISAPKAWLAIALSWSLALAFGFASAFRSDTLHYNAPQSTPDGTESPPPSSDAVVSPAAQLYDLTFSIVYIVLIILMPIGLVCGMYWKIVTEAKRNGLRMRQNGSSPLLQSALNLAATSSAVVSSSQSAKPANSLPVDSTPRTASTVISISAGTRTASSSSLLIAGDGLIMNIDRQQSLSHDESTAALLPSPAHPPPSTTATPSTTRRYLEIPSTLLSTATDKNHNSLLAVPMPSGGIRGERASMNMPRNLSSRHLFGPDVKPTTAAVSSALPLTSGGCKSTATLMPTATSAVVPMRHVRSTPNLQKADINGSQHAIAMHRLHHHQQQQLPSTGHAIPCKALCYMSSIRHRLSNASSIFKYREESRAARISVLVVVMCLVSYLPYGVLVLLEGFRWVGGAPQAQLNCQLAAVVCVMVSNIGSPFIFAYRNKRVRRGVCHLFRLDAKTRDRMHKQTTGSTSMANSRPASGASMGSSKTPGSRASFGQPTVVVSIASTAAEPATTNVAANTTTLATAEASSDRHRPVALLKRAYVSAARKLSCTPSTCGSEAEAANAGGNSAPNGTSGNGCAMMGCTLLGCTSGNEGGATDSRRQSSDV